MADSELCALLASVTAAERLREGAAYQRPISKISFKFKLKLRRLEELKKPEIVFSKAVGTSEFESPTSSMSTRRSNQLSYAPIASEVNHFTQPGYPSQPELSLDENMLR